MTDPGPNPRISFLPRASRSLQNSRPSWIPGNHRIRDCLRCFLRWQSLSKLVNELCCSFRWLKTKIDRPLYRACSVNNTCRYRKDLIGLKSYCLVIFELDNKLAFQNQE